MTLNPYTGRGRGWRQWVSPALQVGGAVAGQIYRDYMSRPVIVQQPPQTYQQPQVVYVQPQQQSAGRSRPRRGRGRGRGQGRARVPRPTAPIGTQGSGVVTVVDTEMFAPIGFVTGVINVMQFNPGHSKLPRLNRQAGMYERYRVVYVTVKFVPAVATTTTGSLYFSICPGPSQTAVKTADDILKLRPSRCVAVWQSATINMGQAIDTQRYMVCGDTSVDGTAFTLYYQYGNTAAGGHFQVSYKIEFAYPKVFQ
uniref:Capsid protein n=1 Tax=Soybean thrips tombus-like virus 4 TaxID=2802946 RepID=A0A7T8JIP1_9TOMB|nr:hypothetical protein 2 [Soybean thrips tombus-like virus 4]